MNNMAYNNNNNINDLPPECLYEISKEIEGELHYLSITNQDCHSKGESCLVRIYSYDLKADIKSFLQCDSKKMPNIDGVIEANIVFKFLGNGQRGKHHGIFKWSRDPEFVIEGEMDGIHNACTHHKPLPECGGCYQNYNIEGIINGNMKFQKSNNIQDYKISAMYAMDVIVEDNLEPFSPGINSRVTGTIEGIASRLCK